MFYVFLSDLARYAVVIMVLWTMALWLRIALLRIRSDGWRGRAYPTPLLSAGLLFLISLIIVRRFDRLGQPGDAFLWLVLVGVVALLVGTMQSVKINWMLPWRRHQHH